MNHNVNIVHVNMHVEARDKHSMVFYIILCGFWDEDSQWIKSSLIQLDWLPSMSYTSYTSSYLHLSALGLQACTTVCDFLSER